MNSDHRHNDAYENETYTAAFKLKFKRHSTPLFWWPYEFDMMLMMSNGLLPKKNISF